MYFSNVTAIDQLKGEYRRLAARYHPDRGGNAALMTRINVEYETLLASLKSGMPGARARVRSGNRQQDRRRRFFHGIAVGETVYVNGTECEVLEVTQEAFRVVAKGRTRQSWFLKSDGYGQYNKRIRAAWVRDNRRVQADRRVRAGA